MRIDSVGQDRAFDGFEFRLAIVSELDLRLATINRGSSRNRIGEESQFGLGSGWHRSEDDGLR